VTDPRTQATRTQMDTGGIGRTGASGWAFFVGILLFMVGVFNVIWGLAALIDDKSLTVSGQGVIVWDLTTWGWIHLLLGIVLIGTAVGLFAGRGWARWTAIFFVMVNAFGQIVWIPVHPLWTVLIITLDIIIIYQLTARWEVEDRY
jgi:cytochrome c oxidase subunit IV